MNIRILVLFISVVFAGGCATSTPYPSVTSHTPSTQNSTTAPQQQVDRTVVAAQQQPVMVVQQQQTLLRFAIWQGLGPAQPFDNTIATIKGLAGAAESVNRALNPERFFGYGGRHLGYQFGYHNIQPYYIQPYIMYHDPVIRRH